MNRCVCFPPLLLATVLLWTSPARANAGNDERVHDRAAIRNTAEEPASLSARKDLPALIRMGRLAEMRWPSFADQRRTLEDFYKPDGYELAWINEAGRPTEQALALIAALETADQQGLRPEDYDGPLWEARVAHLESSS